MQRLTGHAVTWLFCYAVKYKCVGSLLADRLLTAKYGAIVYYCQYINLSFVGPNWLHVRSNLVPRLTYDRLMEKIYLQVCLPNVFHP